jgi:hypothetical protein
MTHLNRTLAIAGILCCSAFFGLLSSTSLFGQACGNNGTKGWSCSNTQPGNKACPNLLCSLWKKPNEKCWGGTGVVYRYAQTQTLAKSTVCAYNGKDSGGCTMDWTVCATITQYTDFCVTQCGTGTLSICNAFDPIYNPCPKKPVPVPVPVAPVSGS